jgi:surface polysaccharide O-acyltransferase-like enzyme
LQRKGAAGFLRDRARRLGIPFVIGALLMPIAYYPAFLQRDQTGGFIAQWMSLPYWPAGPLWFIWVLLSFDAIAALIVPRMEAILERIAGLFDKPLRGFLVLVAASAAVYLPMAALIGPAHWFSFGPFSVQSSRVLHYAVYFTAGAALGTRELVPPRAWLRWLFAAAGCFLISVSLFIAWITQHAASQGWATAVGFGFCLSCAASSMAFIAIFARFGRRGSKHAYGIYLTHYFFVSWLQFIFLPLSWPAPAKALAVFAASAALAYVIPRCVMRVRLLGGGSWSETG